MRLSKHARTVLFVFPIIAVQTSVGMAGPENPSAEPATVSAVIEFPLPALERQLDDLVPRRLATFDDRGSECWHRVIFGRRIDVDCAYEGYIERTGVIHLGVEHASLTGEMPVYGRVSARGLNRLARFLHGQTEARLTVYASTHPRLLPDWSVALNMHEGYRWREPPVVRVLGFPIDLARYAEPAIDRQLALVKERIAANVRSLDIREKAERVWQQMFYPVQLSDKPGLWLQVTPRSVAFSGLNATDQVLQGALELSGTAEASIGAAPAPVQPTPLPALGGDVSAPGAFDVAAPVDLSFDTMASAWQSALASNPQFADGKLKGIEISPSDGKLAISLHLADSRAGRDAPALLVVPKSGADAQTIEFDSVGADGGAPAPFDLESLRQSFGAAIKDRFDAIMASANQRLNEKLANGFRREGHLDIGKPVSIAVLSDRVRVTANAHGYLRFVYDR